MLQEYSISEGPEFWKYDVNLGQGYITVADLLKVRSLVKITFMHSGMDICSYCLI